MFYHDNYRTLARYYVRVGRDENIQNGQIFAPVPIPRNVRLPTPAPRPFVPMAPAPLSRNKNKNNAKYVKSMITKIIHKLTEPNRRNKANREYISRLVGGIVSKIKRQNNSGNRKNKPRKFNSTENVFTRIETGARPFIVPTVNKKTQVIRALIAKGMTKKEAEIQELFMNNNDVNNLLRHKTPNRRSPLQYNTGGKKYLSPLKLPQIIVAESEAAIKAMPAIVRQVNRSRNQRAVHPNVSTTSYGVQPSSSVAPKPKPKKNNARARLLKTLSRRK
jgi:hypothetical protein